MLEVFFVLSFPVKLQLVFNEKDALNKSNQPREVLPGYGLMLLCDLMCLLMVTDHHVSRISETDIFKY